MNKLTLPIEIGRRYVRRDGIMVQAMDRHPRLMVGCVYVGSKATAPYDAGVHAWASNGLIYTSHELSLFDLVADYIEPAAVDAELPKGHPHAASMALYAQDAAETTEPWKRWEWREYGGDSIYRPCTMMLEWKSGMEYRRKPRTIRINGVDVPEPLREAPALGTPYFYPSTTAINPVVETQWNLPSDDERLLKRGLCHLTREAADLHARALLSFTQVKP